MIDLDPQASSANWGDRRTAQAPVVRSAHASRLPHELQQIQAAGGDMVVVDTAPPTARHIALFYLAAALLGLLLSFGAWQGGRVSLELGTGGYIDNLRVGAVVLAGLFILVEYGLLRWQHQAAAYNWKDSTASFAIYVFNGALGPLTVLWQFGLLRLVEPHALFQINDGLIPLSVTFVLAEGAYYWYHRLSHEVPLLWAIHHTHHSAQTLNLSIAFRLHPLGRLASPLVYVPLVFVGFKPEYILGALAASLVYQFFLHTQTVGPLWGVEHAGFNTPSLHRVHHGTNAWCIDKNYGGALIFWDSVFGTLQRERGPIHYGVTTGHYSYNPMTVLLGPLREWASGNFARERAVARLGVTGDPAHCGSAPRPERGAGGRGN